MKKQILNIIVGLGLILGSTTFIGAMNDNNKEIEEKIIKEEKQEEVCLVQDGQKFTVHQLHELQKNRKDRYDNAIKKQKETWIKEAGEKLVQHLSNEKQIKIPVTSKKVEKPKALRLDLEVLSKERLLEQDENINQFNNLNIVDQLKKKKPKKKYLFVTVAEHENIFKDENGDCYCVIDDNGEAKTIYQDEVDPIYNWNNGFLKEIELPCCGKNTKEDDNLKRKISGALSAVGVSIYSDEPLSEEQIKKNIIKYNNEKEEKEEKSLKQRREMIKKNKEKKEKEVEQKKNKEAEEQRKKEVVEQGNAAFKTVSKKVFDYQVENIESKLNEIKNIHKDIKEMNGLEGKAKTEGLKSKINSSKLGLIGGSGLTVLFASFGVACAFAFVFTLIHIIGQSLTAAEVTAKTIAFMNKHNIKMPQEFAAKVITLETYMRNAKWFNWIRKDSKLSITGFVIEVLVCLGCGAGAIACAAATVASLIFAIKSGAKLSGEKKELKKMEESASSADLV